eukprot:TRINITY_DN28091_c0_g1_i1.p1 TRINITY_DN28091_c0_g1~~TRINITY_DN28091_c0_g1_i1.p1  ORF type:complete len:160 (+),score=34.41 TRINITY_DN28091_c0_g1_i1:65-544(+)
MFFFQAEDGIRDLVRSRGLGDVYKRQCFMGVMPRLCPRVLLIGYSRPHFEGLCNIIEMQGLLCHRLITESGEFERILSNLDERIDQYNLQQYGTVDRISNRHGDHLVMFSEYVRQVAKLLNIPRFSGSIRDFPMEAITHLPLPDPVSYIHLTLPTTYPV